MTSRRDLFRLAGVAGGALAGATVARSALAALPEPVIETSAETRPPLAPSAGRPYKPVVTLNGWSHARWRQRISLDR